MKLDAYFLGYFNPDEAFPDYRMNINILQTIQLGSIALFVIPLTVYQQKNKVRHSVLFFAIVLNRLSGYFMLRLNEEGQFAWIIGPMTGFCEASVIVFPILKIRDYFTEFEKKIWYSGLFFGMKYLLTVTIAYFIQVLAQKNIDQTGKNTNG